jgi:hypothetical protein
MSAERREWKAGEQDLFFDESKQVLWVRLNAPMTVEEYQEIMQITGEVFGGRSSRCIWDLQGRSLRLPREVRRAMREQVKADGERGLGATGKSAIIGTTYSVRVLAMIFIRLLGSQAHTCFCRTEAEAHDFLRGD